MTYFDMGLNVIGVVVALVCVVVTYFKYSFTYWSRRNVPTLTPSIPFGNFGPSIMLKTTSGEHIQDLYNQLKKTGKPYGGLYIFTKPLLLVLDPELARHIMTKDFNSFHARPIYYDEINDPLSGHLVNLNGIKWKNLRSKLTPTFTSGKMKMMFQTLVSCSDELSVIVDRLADNDEAIDIKDLVGRFTTDIIGSCAFGLDCNSLKDPDTEFRKFGKEVFAITGLQSLKITISNNFPKFFKMLGLKRTPKNVHNFFMGVVKDTVKYREDKQVSRKDFMELLIQLKNKGSVEDEDVTSEPGTKLTIEEVAAQSFVFFLAGFETSSTASCFFMYDMAMHQDIQDRCREEINTVLQKHDGTMTYEAVMEMTYLDKAVNETMRLHAVIPSLIRKCTEDYKLPDSDVIIQKGTSIFIPVLGFQKDPEFFPDPDVYDPERFSSEEKAKRHPYTFLPFGEGPRNCIGLRFGLMQTKVGLAVLLKNHRFTLSEKTQMPIKMDPRCMIFSALGGIWLKATRV